MFLPRHKVVFIHIPKCGGTSIEQSLIRAGGYESFPPEELLLYKNRKPWKGPPSVGHLAANQYVSKGYLARSDWDNSFKFTVVRNPFSRLVSAYNYRGVSWRARNSREVQMEFPRICVRLFSAMV